MSLILMDQITIIHGRSRRWVRAIVFPPEDGVGIIPGAVAIMRRRGLHQ